MHPWSFSSKWETRKVTAGKYTCLRLLLGLQSVILFVIALEMACHKSNYQPKKKSTIRNMGVDLGKGGRDGKTNMEVEEQISFFWLIGMGFNKSLTIRLKKKKSILWGKKWLPSWLLLALQETWVSSLGQKIPWRKKWHTPVFLPGKPQGLCSLEGYSPRGCRVGHDWVGPNAVR